MASEEQPDFEAWPLCKAPEAAEDHIAKLDAKVLDLEAKIGQAFRDGWRKGKGVDHLTFILDCDDAWQEYRKERRDGEWCNSPTCSAPMVDGKCSEGCKGAAKKQTLDQRMAEDYAKRGFDGLAGQSPGIDEDSNH